MFLLALAPFVGACAAAAPPSASVKAPVEAASVAAPLVARCAATPGTVYGDEPVVFEVEGQAVDAVMVDATLRDERRQIVARSSTALPGKLRWDGIPSGDFALAVGPADVTCSVTVNRELSRASQGGSQGKN